ncbi:NitT/TauT family transport system permease protein [Oikeobacillus pervagus]|uniref:NitT/TauT family transport system permease protein n=1 Tax=Oikeobacillus pervagus TaxID=1325931 RepID=A0AAJ1T444_9BACI|nr:ABC transporter permease [Oikeobacillus pervagus]MDQ0214866.1 NitT/TauT family transport system permease protein [Oikeobacillus pervagus]
MQRVIKQIVFYVLFIVIWEMSVRAGGWGPDIMPKPTDVWEALIQGFIDKTLIYDLGASFQRLLIGLTIALILGTSLGILLAKSQTADDTLGSLILALQSVPSIVWLPLAIMWFGLNEKAVIFIVVLGGTLVMTINMRIGIKNVSPLYIKAAQTMGSSGFDLFIKIIFPASIPYAVTGARLAWAFAWRALMAGEILSTGPGLGYTLKYASDFGNMSLVIAVMILIGVIGTIVDLLFFQRVEKNVMRRWGLEQASS